MHLGRLNPLRHAKQVCVNAKLNDMFRFRGARELCIGHVSQVRSNAINTQ
jgi:hypothetical protein